MIRLRASHDGPVSRIVRRSALLLTLAMLATGSGVAAAQVAVPGGPDAPPPDPPAPSRPSNPAPSRPATPSPSPSPSAPAATPTQPTQTGPTPAELEAQQLAQQRREAARRAAILKARQEAIARAKRERAAEFRDLAAFTAARNTVREDAQNAAASLNRAADGAKLVALSPDPASRSGGSGSSGTPLLYLLLIASAISAGLVFLPVALERRRASQAAAGESSRLIAAVEARTVFVERHRVELAGVASACLLVALLIAVGLV